MKKYILLAGILLLGIILRSYQLNLFPNGFFSDEAAIEYSGYKILTTGKDEYGVLFPFFFKSLGDYRNPVSIYSSIPFILLFGLSEFSARFVTAVYGTFTVLVVFLFVSRIFSHKTGLIAAFLLSISAWHIHISRWGAEYAPYPFFVLLTCFFIVSSFKKQRFLIWAAVTGGIGLYTYYPSWIVMPIVFFTGIFYWFIVNRRKITWVPFIAVIIFMCSFFPLAMGIREGHALTRWDRVTNNTVALSEKINKYFLYYKDHFLPLYLFQKGDLEYPGRFITRQFVNREGFLYRFTALFILFGIIISILKRKTGWPLIIVLLLIYPLGSALTLEGPSTTRSFIGILPFVILPGLGIGGFIKFLNKWKLIQFVMVIGLVVISSFELHRYIKNYYIDYPLIASDFWGWQYGPRAILTYYSTIQDKYDELYMAGEFNGAEIFIPFYTEGGSIKCSKCKGGGVELLDLSKRQLFEATPALLEKWGNPNYKIIHTFYYPDRKPAFHIVRYTKSVEKKR